MIHGTNPHTSLTPSSSSISPQSEKDKDDPNNPVITPRATSNSDVPVFGRSQTSLPTQAHTSAFPSFPSDATLNSSNSNTLFSDEFGSQSSLQSLIQSPNTNHNNLILTQARYTCEVHKRLIRSKVRRREQGMMLSLEHYFRFSQGRFYRLKPSLLPRSFSLPQSSPTLRPSSPRPRSSSHGSSPYSHLSRSLTGAASPNPLVRPWYLIPAGSPYKAVWDIATVLLTLYSFLLTHSHISSRNHGVTESGALVELWFVVDILLNFFTEYKSMEGEVTPSWRGSAGQYLRTWFFVDLLSVIPWELWFLQPVIDMQNARGVWKKTFFRSKGVLKVTRVLRGRHFKLLSKISSRTAKFGVGTSRIVKGLIKYLPKYIQFVKRMKFVLPVRTVRAFHSWYKMFKNFVAVQRTRFGARRRGVARVDSLGSIREEEGGSDAEGEGAVADVMGTTGVWMQGGGGEEDLLPKPGLSRRHTVANVRRERG